MSIEDRAQDHEARMWEIINTKRIPGPPVKAPGEPGYGPAECQECGADMHAVRRGYGFKLCTPCAGAHER